MIGSACGRPQPCAARFSVPVCGRPADKAAQFAATLENRIQQCPNGHFKLSAR